jgi:hypothetical protein
MYDGMSPVRSSRQDWLPWALSVFAAACAVFVLVRGVLPTRAANQRLTQTVLKLESELLRTAQSQSEERAQAAARLAEQSAAAEEKLAAVRREERARVALETAKRDLGRQLASPIGEGAVALEERNGSLVVLAHHDLVFASRGSALKASGRKFLKQVAQSMKRLPSEQVYRIGGPGPAQQRAAMRFLEVAGRVPGEQLVLGGPAASAANTGPAGEPFEITLLSPEKG